MAANQPPWPRAWLMTDERLGGRLWQAVDALPEAAGIVFRHYGLADEARLELGTRLAERARQRGLLLAVAGSERLAEQLGVQLVHNPVGEPGLLPFSRSAHSLKEAATACSSGASLIFLSPIHATRSHPGRKPLPRDTARRIVADCPVPVIALGGMNRERFDQLRSDGFYGWAGIDAWLEK